MRPIIEIQVSGPVQSGKSAIAATIRDVLGKHSICVAIPDRAERNNPSAPLETCARHEWPRTDCVVILTETVEPRKVVA